jgi:hypothetical protein
VRRFLAAIFGGLRIELTSSQERYMNSKVVLAISIAVGSLLAVGSSTNAGIAAAGVRAAVDSLAVAEPVQYRFGGHRHCWYPDGWHGTGWYWCGYGHRRGLGWGGGEGWHGWRHR